LLSTEHHLGINFPFFLKNWSGKSPLIRTPSGANVSPILISVRSKNFFHFFLFYLVSMPTKVSEPCLTPGMSGGMEHWLCSIPEDTPGVGRSSFFIIIFFFILNKIVTPTNLPYLIKYCPQYLVKDKNISHKTLLKFIKFSKIFSVPNQNNIQYPSFVYELDCIALIVANRNVDIDFIFFFYKNWGKRKIYTYIVYIYTKFTIDFKITTFKILSSNHNTIYDFTPFYKFRWHSKIKWNKIK